MIITFIILHLPTPKQFALGTLHSELWQNVNIPEQGNENSYNGTKENLIPEQNNIISSSYSVTHKSNNFINNYTSQVTRFVFSFVYFSTRALPSVLFQDRSKIRTSPFLVHAIQILESFIFKTSAWRKHFRFKYE